MKKWTTNGTNAYLGMNKVSLTKILEFRPHLNEIECWALLGQTAHALQDILLKANGRRHFATKITSIESDCCPVIYPDRILTQTTGKISLDNSSLTLDCQSQYIHPLLGTNQLYRENYSEEELEQLGIYSLGKTIQACQCLDSSSILTGKIAENYYCYTVWKFQDFSATWILREITHLG